MRAFSSNWIVDVAFGTGNDFSSRHLEDCVAREMSAIAFPLRLAVVPQFALVSLGHRNLVLPPCGGIFPGSRHGRRRPAFEPVGVLRSLRRHDADRDPRTARIDFFMDGFPQVGLTTHLAHDAGRAPSTPSP